MQLHEYLDRVADEETFLEFARALAHDKADEDKKEKANPSHPYGPGHNEWENGSIVQFLDAAISWAEASKFGRTQDAPENPWKKFAIFLYCGKIYE